MAYASRTGTKRNIAALRAAGWGVMLTAGEKRDPNGFRWCIDNGAWTAHQSGAPFDEAAFVKTYQRRRVALCAMAGADSIDGTSVTRFASTLPLMDNAIRQWALPCM
jgi:hypothetical protein